MLTADQLAIRRGRITASEVGAILGLHPTRTPFDAWESITGRSTFRGNESTAWGDRLEPQILAFVSREYDAPVVPGETVLRDEWAAATPDGYLLGSDGVPVALVEAKAVGKWKISDWRDADGWRVPLYVEAQVRFQSFVTGVGEAVVAVAFDDADRWKDADHFDYRLAAFEIEHDAEAEEMMIGTLHDWHARYILTDEPPPTEVPDQVRRALLAARAKMVPVAELKKVAAGSPAHQLFTLYEQFARDEKHAKAEKEKLRDALIRETGAFKGLSFPDGGEFVAKAQTTVEWKELALELGATQSQIDAHTRRSVQFTTRRAKGKE